MSTPYEDDPLGGYDDLNARQQAAVNRMSARARRHEVAGYTPTIRDRSEAFARAEIQEERWRFGPS